MKDEPNTDVDKTEVVNTFRALISDIQSYDIPDQLLYVGSVVGMFAMTLERMYGLPRAQVFKMIQRSGYATLKQMDEAERKKSK